MLFDFYKDEPFPFFFFSLSQIHVIQMLLQLIAATDASYGDNNWQLSLVSREKSGDVAWLCK